ncbi:nucleus protein [Ophiostoma piceae UAMH 11346]|uniref:Nucleus protein n=1 Tax=Ophiostoma piceae (strain UAMH 11346) TaxID=1262450 RepID=S3BZI6_OPHP1|nr:nucleus protein [Ophiostoma piceae UAMH 11346]
MDGQVPIGGGHGLGGYGQPPTSAPPPPQPVASAAGGKGGTRAKRVPEHQRRRAAVSCDHCKQRRAKCMRASPRDPCSNCIASRIKCQSTLPRKQRVYGSVESLSLRYRALEALVQGLLDPDGKAKSAQGDHASDDESMLDDGAAEGASSRTAALDIDALYRAAAERDIPMPPRDDMTPANEIFAASSQAGGSSSAGPALGASHSLPTIVQPPVPPPGTSTTSLPSLSSVASLIPADGSVLPFQHPHPPQHRPLTTPAADEKLIPTPNGVAHYVGPSSSFRFVTSIRALVAQCGDSIVTGLNGGGDVGPGGGVGGASESGSVAGASPATGSRGGPTPSATGDGSSSSHTQGENQGQSSIRDQFVGLKVSKALEIQDSGSNEDDDDEGSDESGEDAEYSGDDRDAMDGVVKDPRPPSFSQSQSAHPPPYANQQQTLPSRHYTPRSGHEGGGSGTVSASSPANSRRSRPEPDDASFSGTFLPPRETADIFVRVFFDRVHPNYPLFHRGSFLLRYEALWQRGQAQAAGNNAGEAKKQSGDSGADDDYGWNCCLAMVFAFGAQALEGHDRARKAAASMQRRYLHLVCSSLSRLAGTTNLANIQALMLLQLYEHNAGRRNAAWSFLGCASRMAVALGMHRDGVVPLPKDSGGKGAAVNDRDARRRVWWTLYSFERNLCIMLGRPSALDETEIAVAPPTDDVQSADLPQGLPVSLLSLIRMTWKIKQLRFPAPGSQPNFYGYGFGYGNPQQTAHELLNELEAWRVALPAHLQPGWRSMIPSHRRAVLALHVQHQYGRSLVTRQFVLDRAERCCNLVADKSDSKYISKLPSDHDTIASDELADSCLDASERVNEYLHQLFDAGLLDGVAWIDAYYLYHSVLILCLDLVAKIVVVGHVSTSAADKATLTEAVARQRASVRSILLLAQRTRLAPTFRVLVGVVCQLAAIVGALDGLLALPPPATTIDGSSLSSSSSGKHHHHHHHHSHSRQAGGHRSNSSTRGRGRQRRNSSSVSSDRKTSQGPFNSQTTTSTVATGGVSMAPPSASPQLRTAAGQPISDKSSPNMFYSPPAPNQMHGQGQYQHQHQPQQQQPQQPHHQQPHHIHQQQQQQQQQQLQHQHSSNPQQQIQLQQLQAFAGEWFTNDTGQFPWNSFDPSSINVVGGTPQGAHPGGHGSASGPSGGGPGAAAAAVANSGMISPTSTVPAPNFYPQSFDFGMATEPATFAEDPYLSQPDFFGRQPPSGGSAGANGPGGGGRNVPPQAYSGNMEMDQYTQQGLNLQQQPQMDNSEWVQAWRELSTRYHQ